MGIFCLIYLKDQSNDGVVLSLPQFKTLHSYRLTRNYFLRLNMVKRTFVYWSKTIIGFTSVKVVNFNCSVIGYIECNSLFMYNECWYSDVSLSFSLPQSYSTLIRSEGDENYIRFHLILVIISVCLFEYRIGLRVRGSHLLVDPVDPSKGLNLGGVQNKEVIVRDSHRVLSTFFPRKRWKKSIKIKYQSGK